MIVFALSILGSAVCLIAVIALGLVMSALMPSPSDWLRIRRTVDKRTNKTIHVPHWIPFAGSFGEMMSDYDGFFERRLEDANRLGHMIVWFLFDPHVQLCRPDDIKQVLFGNDLDYFRDNSSFYLMHKLFGRGVLNVDGQEWRDQHRILYKAFASDNLTCFRPAFAKQATQLVEKLKVLAGKGTPVDLLVMLNEVTLGVMIDTAFGNTLLPNEQDEFRVRLVYVLKETANFVHQIPILNSILADTAKVDKNMVIMRELVDRALKRRLEGKDVGCSDHLQIKRYLIDLIIDANAAGAEDSYHMDDITVRDNMVCLMAAGMETTATAMNWTLYFIATHPEVRRQVLAENEALDLAVLEEPGDLAKHVPYLTTVIQEAMRMRSPVSNIPGRRPRQDMEVGDLIVPAGVPLVTFSHQLHMNPMLWDSPKEFRPERFAKGGEAADHRCKFMPFGVGRRYCIGKYMAMAELQVVLSNVLRKLSFEFVGTEADVKPAFRPPTVQPSVAMKMRVSAR